MFRQARRSRLFLALLCFGALALVLNSLGGMNPARAPSANGLIEICTAQGMVSIDPSTGAVAVVSSSSSEHSAPRCCDLCAPCNVPDLASAEVKVLAVAFASFVAQAPPEATEVSFPHPELSPLVPRGPPALS